MKRRLRRGELGAGFGLKNLDKGGRNVELMMRDREGLIFFEIIPQQEFIPPFKAPSPVVVIVLLVR